MKKIAQIAIIVLLASASNGYAWDWPTWAKIKAMFTPIPGPKWQKLETYTSPTGEKFIKIPTEKTIIPPLVSGGTPIEINSMSIPEEIVPRKITSIKPNPITYPSDVNPAEYDKRFGDYSIKKFSGNYYMRKTPVTKYFTPKAEADFARTQTTE